MICSNILSREVDQVRLDVNCSAAANWCEIDCIQLVGHTSHGELSFKELTFNLKQLLADDCLSDVTFQLDNGQTISSHRNILTVRCLYFEQLFEEYPPNSSEPIRIPNISYEAFYQILHFIFTDAIEPMLTHEICLELMRKADDFYLSAIYNQAFDIIKKTVNKNNALKLFTQSGLFPATAADSCPLDGLTLDDVVNLSVEFIQKNRREVYLNEQMKDLTKEMLLQLVQLVL